MAKTPNQGDLISLILDAAGHLDMLINSSLRGSYVEALTPGGTTVFASSFSCQASFLGPLASGNDFLVMQTGACVLSLQGGPAFTFSPAPAPGDFAAIVLDANDNLYVSESTSTADRYDANGQRRWTTPLAHSAVGGPLLADDGEMLLLEADLSQRPIARVTVAALATASGTTVWSREVATSGDLAGIGVAPFLLTDASRGRWWANGATRSILSTTKGRSRCSSSCELAPNDEAPSVAGPDVDLGPATHLACVAEQDAEHRSGLRHGDAQFGPGVRPHALVQVVRDGAAADARREERSFAPGDHDCPPSGSIMRCSASRCSTSSNTARSSSVAHVSGAGDAAGSTGAYVRKARRVSS